MTVQQNITEFRQTLRDRFSQLSSTESTEDTGNNTLNFLSSSGSTDLEVLNDVLTSFTNSPEFTGTAQFDNVLIANTMSAISVNAAVTINSAQITVGNDFIVDTTGVFHTGVVNAATLSVGSNFIANTTGISVGNNFIANTTTIAVGNNTNVEIASLLKSNEILQTLTSATGTVTHNINSSQIFYHTSIAANFTANFTNVSTTNNRTTTITLLLNQGATAYIPNAVQIEGVAQTIKWQGGTAPTGNANKLDIVTFVLVRVSGSWASVIGQLSSYG